MAKCCGTTSAARAESVHRSVRTNLPVNVPRLYTHDACLSHLAGTARMGEDPRTSVCAASGRMHDLENVYVADASTFPTFPGFNPTLTIMANALRISRGLATGPKE